MSLQIQIDHDRIAEFCRKWMIVEFSLFGSVLRDDFRPDSDVDVLIRFQEGHPWGLWEWSEMIDELQAMFGRKVDLVSIKGLVNPYRRKSILSTREIIYEAA